LLGRILESRHAALYGRIAGERAQHIVVEKRSGGPHIDQRRRPVITSLRNIEMDRLAAVKRVLQNQCARRRQLLKRKGGKVLPEMTFIRIGSESPIRIGPYS